MQQPPQYSDQGQQGYPPPPPYQQPSPYQPQVPYGQVKPARRPSIIGPVLAALILGMILGVGLDRYLLPSVGSAAAPPAATSGSGSNSSSGLNYDVINQAYNLINSDYVDRSAVKPDSLSYGAISGMVNSLGDTGHSRFLTPFDLKQEQNVTTGSFEGIGATVEMRNDRPTIVAPIDGSPAQKIGLQPGDVMLAVNGKSTEGQTLQQVVSQVLGPAGTKVTITIFTPKTNKTRDVTITRARIELHNVTWRPLPGTTVAHLRIAEFSNGVNADLQKALKEIQAQHMTGVILDLRNNPGGLLDEAVGTASNFLSGGDVLLEQNAKGEKKSVPVEHSSVKLTDMPMVVLINQGSASASEIVSGAIQDAKRAKLVGETTFGTGTVLNTFQLSDGSALLLATEQWLTPSGRVIWHHGITPDVQVQLDPNAEILIPEAEDGLTADQLKSSQDTQVLKALELLNSK